MKSQKTLHELLQQDPQSKALYERLPRDVQAALQEQRQSIHTYEELSKTAEGFEKRSRK